MSQRMFDFEIIGPPKPDGYDLKITSVVDAELVKIDQKIGRVIVSTSGQTEEVAILYELIPENPTSVLQNPPQGATAADESFKMTITIKNQGKDLILHTSESCSGADAAGPMDVRTMGFVASDDGTGTTDNTSSSRRRLRSHDEHDMTLIIGDCSSYKCSGCKESGIGDRYICKNEECPYILHTYCRFYEENATHEFLNGSTLKFFEEHFDEEHRYCDACGLDIKGYFYHCQETNKNLDPCCLNLQKTVQVGEMKFQLCEKLTSRCFYCCSEIKDNKDKCWCYSSENLNSQAHVSCMKNALLKCLKGESNDEMSWVEKKITALLEWAKMLYAKATPYMKKAKALLEKIIPLLEGANMYLQKTAPTSKWTIFFWWVTQVLRWVSKGLEFVFSAFCDEPSAQCSHSIT